MSDELTGFNADQKLSLYKYIGSYNFSQSNLKGIEDAFKDMLAISQSEQALKTGLRLQALESKVDNIIGLLKFIIASLATVSGKIIYDILFTGGL